MRQIIKTTKNIVVGAAIIMLALAGVAAASDAYKEQAAVTAAEKWLALVDKGNYAASWKEAAEVFRTTVEQERWEQLLWAVREPLGKVISSKMKSATYKTSLPGAPDGEYFIILFETSFENMKSAVETVVSVMARKRL